jgi:hypothetical protein
VPQISEEQRLFVDELLPIDKKPHECHACGKRDDIYSWDFGLGKKTGTKRNWFITAASLGLSAITVPLLGSGMLRLPGKEMRFRILRLKLILCDSCRDSRFSYNFHPWWEPARRLLLIRLFQQTHTDSMSECLGQRFQKPCGNFNRSLQRRRPANSILPTVAGRMASCARNVETAGLMN